MVQMLMRDLKKVSALERCCYKGFLRISSGTKFLMSVLRRFHCNKLIPKRIGHWKSEIGSPNCTFSYPECVLKYIGHLASRNTVGEIWEYACKISITDFWSSVIVDSHELYKVTIFVIIITNKFDRLKNTDGKN